MLVLQQLSLQQNLDDQEAEMKRKDELHQAKVDWLKEDASRRATLFDVLKKDLEQALQGKATAEKQEDDLESAMSKRAQDDQKLKQMCLDNKEKANKAEAE